jgi:hypothetical protein
MNEERLPPKELEEYVMSYLDSFVTLPCMDMIRKHPQCHLRAVSLLARVMYLTHQVMSHGSDFDMVHLNSLSPDELNQRIDTMKQFFNSDDPDEAGIAQDVHRYLMSADSQKYLLAYVSREFNWIIISIMSASYISSLVLMRSVFELLIGVATKTTGKMKERVDGISFLHEDERKEILKLWRRLCGWSHPYGRWVKEVCPVYVHNAPFFHERLCEHCLDELCCLVDFYAVTALSKYEIPIDPSCQPMQDPGDTLGGLGMLTKRITSES